MIAVFDPSPLAVCINYSIFTFIFAVLLPVFLPLFSQFGEKVKMRHRAKFRDDLSYRYRCIAVFNVQYGGCHRILENLQISLVDGVHAGAKFC